MLNNFWIEVLVIVWLLYQNFFIFLFNICISQYLQILALNYIRPQNLLLVLHLELVYFLQYFNLRFQFLYILATYLWNLINLNLILPFFILYHFFCIFISFTNFLKRYKLILYRLLFVKFQFLFSFKQFIFLFFCKWFCIRLSIKNKVIFYHFYFII